jgi:Secretion system C-terminal sorting domain/Cleaved Adhesin Domain
VVEHLQYATAPGTNGETEFHNVMRQMYPDADGKTVGSNWTNGQTQNIIIAGAVPAYVDKSENVFLVVWLQNDSSKFVLQAGKSSFVPIAIDISAEAVTTTPGFQCASTNVNQNHIINLKNKGTSTITSANINYRLDNGSYLTQAWTGSLASGASVNYTMPNVSAGGGSHFVIDSVTNINGEPLEVNSGNNINFAFFNIHSTIVNPLPISVSFENAGSIPAGVTLIDQNANGQQWRLVSSTGNIGASNSKYCIYHENYNFKSPESNVAILPTINHSAAGAKVLEFAYAYATYATEKDALDIVYSTNCGTSWSSIWNKSGTDLQTALPTTSPFVPTQAQWKFDFVDISSVPANAIFGFKATSAYGNNLFIDNINIKLPTAIQDVINANSIIISPNPSNSNVNVSMMLPSTSDVNLTIVDMTGKTVFTKSISNINNIEEKINVSNFATGIYNLVIKTNKGIASKKLTVTN